jgi:thioredoxin 1
MIHDLTKATLATLIEKSDKPVVVKVFAPWCGPCMQMKPFFKDIAAELSDTYTFTQLNVDEERDLAIQYGITVIPTILFIKNNEIQGREVGYLGKDAFIKKIHEYLGS